MNCEEFKNNLIFFCEDNVSEAAKEHLLNHLNSCSSCSLVYHHIKEELHYIETEKKTSINPYFVNKVLLKVKEENYPPEKIVFPYPAFSFALVLSAGIIIGIILGNLFQTENTNTAADNFKNEIFSPNDNDILTFDQHELLQ